MTFIDRRPNSKKNIINRQRFLERAKENIRKQVRQAKNIDRSITSNDGEKIKINQRGLEEPSFRHSRKHGIFDIVAPGNDHLRGDRFRKPESGSGSGKKGSDDGEGEDDFEFSLTRDEYFDILFEDLELPNLEKKENADKVDAWVMERAGYTTTGPTNKLDLKQTYIRALGRHIALDAMFSEEERELRDELEKLLSDEELQRVRSRLEEIEEMKTNIPFLDNVDLRYRTHEQKPLPITKAVMFCAMDVSGSMGEREKEIAKVFYFFLYLFLTKRYQKVEIVFIRHTHVAQEVDENTFFYSKETGGTVVSTALELIDNIIKERYALNEWNLYVTQISDGDNYPGDNETVMDILLNRLLPVVQYYIYINITDPQEGMYFSDVLYGSPSSYGLWSVYDKITKPNFIAKQVASKQDIKYVFREIFKPKKETSND